MIWNAVWDIKQRIVTKGSVFLGLCLACLVSAGCAFCLPAPSQSSPSRKPDYSKEPYVVENFLTAVQLENNGTETRETTVRVRVQSDAGVKAYGLLAFGYNSANESLEIEYVKVIKPDGTVVATPATNIQDVTSAITRAAPMYSDYREKHVAVEGLDVGDEVEYSTQVQDIKPVIPGQFWFNFDFVTSQIALNEELTVSVPSGRKIIVKSPDFKPAITEQDGRRRYTWKTANLKDQTPEPVMPGGGCHRPASRLLPSRTGKKSDAGGESLNSRRSSRRPQSVPRLCN